MPSTKRKEIKINIKKLEQKIQIILNNDNFKIRLGEECSSILCALEMLTNNIAKLNDAVGNIEYMKKYYSNIFNNRNKYMNFIVNCENLMYLLEKRRKELKLQFQDFIEELCINDDLQLIVEKELPNLLLVVNKVKLNKEKSFGINEIINYLDEKLDIISYEEQD